MKRGLLLGVLLLCVAGVSFAQSGQGASFREGTHYFKLDRAEPTRKPDVITVTAS